jgi:hypothetical protein
MSEPTGADLVALLARHHVIGKTCPRCGASTWNVGITSLAYTFEVCVCDLADYPHLTEELWHRSCLAEGIVTAGSAEETVLGVQRLLEASAGNPYRRGGHRSSWTAGYATAVDRIGALLRAARVT